MKHIYSCIFLFCISFILKKGIYADTILLSDGTYLVGKVIEWDSRHIIFKNAHGAFAIRKNQLVKLYITGNQNEDIELKDKLGHTIKDEDIIRHYLAGSESVPEGGIDKDEIESEISSDSTGKKLSLSVSYYYTIGQLAEVIPSGAGITLGYTRSISQFLPDESAFWAPDVSIESDIIYFRGDDSKVYDFSINAGPEWKYRCPVSIKNFFTLKILPGATYLVIHDKDYNTNSVTYSLKTSAGYEFPFRGLIASISLTYLYIYDKDIPLTGMGITVSGAYKF